MGRVQHSPSLTGPSPVSAPLAPLSLRNRARLTEAPLQANGGTCRSAKLRQPGPGICSRRLSSSVGEGRRSVEHAGQSESTRGVVLMRESNGQRTIRW